MVKTGEFKPWRVSLVDGGLNVRESEQKIEPNETRVSRNVEILFGGGFEKTPGFTEVMKPIKGVNITEFMTYNEDAGLGAQTQVLAYAPPYILAVDFFMGTCRILYSGLKGTGDPRWAQHREKMIIVDGVNRPIVYNAITGQVTGITWPPVPTNSNPQSVFLQSLLTQPGYPAVTAITVPHDVRVYEKRAYLITRERGALYGSKADNIEDFSDNGTTTTPEPDIAIHISGLTNSSFVGMENREEGLMLYGAEGFWELIGKNVPLPGYPEPLDIKHRGSSIGPIHAKLVAQKDNNDHYIATRHGIYTIELAKEFKDQAAPGGVSYKIFPILQDIGQEALRFARFLTHPANGQLLLFVPRTKYHFVRNKILKLNYGVNPKTNAWSTVEYIGDGAAFDAAVIDPKTNKLYVANGDTIYVNEGNSFFNSEPVQMEYEFRPVDFGRRGVNKFVGFYAIDYFSTTGAHITIPHTWENGSGGTSTIYLPPLSASQYGQAAFGQSASQGGGTFTSSASFASREFIAPVWGTNWGDIWKGKLIHNSATQNLKISSIDLLWKAA